MPTKKKKTAKKTKATKTTSTLLSLEEFRKDAECVGMESKEQLETLRFIKSVRLDSDKKNYTRSEAEKLVDEYREKDALAFARTLQKVLTSKNKNLHDLLLDNAEARLREHKNRPK